MKSRVVDGIASCIEGYINQIRWQKKWEGIKMLLDIHIRTKETPICEGYLTSEYLPQQQKQVWVIQPAAVFDIGDGFLVTIVMSGRDQDLVDVFIQSDLPLEGEPHYRLKSCPSRLFLLKELSELLAEAYPSEFHF